MSAESAAAKLDVYQVCTGYGVPVTLFFEEESDIIRDKYGAIISRSTAPGVAFMCHPLEFNPSADRLEKVGIREMVDILIYFSTYEWELKGKTYSDLDLIRGIGEVLGESYKLQHIKPYSNFAEDYLYIVLGALKN